MKLCPDDGRAALTCPGTPLKTLNIRKKSTSIWLKSLYFRVSLLHHPNTIPYSAFETQDYTGHRSVLMAKVVIFSSN